MPTIEDQLALEHSMSNAGVQRFKSNQKKAEDNGRGCDTVYARKLIQEHITAVEAGIVEYLEKNGARKYGKVRALIAEVDTAVSAYIALRTVFVHFARKSVIQDVITGIGRSIEDEIRFSRFREAHTDYYDKIMKDFKERGTTDYRRMHRVLTFKANEFNDAWVPWTQEERAFVGAALLDVVMQRTELVTRTTVLSAGSKRGSTVITPTEEALKWCSKYSEHMALLDPVLSPCVIPPDDWKDIKQGGYYSAELRSRCSLVLNATRKHEAVLKEADLTCVLNAVNAIQRTAWRVNTRVHDVMKEAWSSNLRIGMPSSEPLDIPVCPLGKAAVLDELSQSDKDAFSTWKLEASCMHTAERQRVSKCFQTVRALRTASEYRKYSRFWYVYQCDFRGRIYTSTTGMSPQGSDTGKALVEFADGKPLGSTGLWWLMVHGANVFGADKIPFDARVKFIKDKHDAILAVSDDPIGNRSVWADADNPWQFLAFCFEYAGAVRDPAHKSHLPVAMDGSCNGLQHYSALLLDPVGGAATNLKPASKPADIYSEVATVCHGKLKENTEHLAALWLEFCEKHGAGCIPRKLAKRPVMTLPYGSTQRTCTNSIYEYVVEKDKDFFPTRGVTVGRASVFLTPILWASIGDVVVSARTAMAWIRKATGVISKAGEHVLWTAPSGWPVLQENYKIETRQIDTQICGRLQVRIGTISDVIDPVRTRNATPPNFVHSLDASHLINTVLSMPDGTNFAMIHDSFGTHACDTDKLRTTLRTEFVRMYDGIHVDNPLSQIQEQVNSICDTEFDLPPTGSLNVYDVLKSEYFFA